MNITIIGAGRAGTSFNSALRAVGHRVQLLHHDELDEVHASDVVLLTVPDDAIAKVANQLIVHPHQVVAHVAGSRTLTELAPHPRVASMHPLAALPSTERGSERLVGAIYCVAGDALIRDVVVSLDGRILTLSDEHRMAYHATASVAANHLVTLMGQVQRLAENAGLSLEDFLPLAQQALLDVGELGPTDALTGPASRGDMATIDAHLGAIPEPERSTYVAMANAAFEMSELRRSRSLA